MKVHRWPEKHALWLAEAKAKADRAMRPDAPVRARGLAHSEARRVTRQRIAAKRTMVALVVPLPCVRCGRALGDGPVVMLDVVGVAPPWAHGDCQAA